MPKSSRASRTPASRSSPEHARRPGRPGSASSVSVSSMTRSEPATRGAARRSAHHQRERRVEQAAGRGVDRHRRVDAQRPPRASSRPAPGRAPPRRTRAAARTARPRPGTDAGRGRPARGGATGPTPRPRPSAPVARSTMGWKLTANSRSAIARGRSPPSISAATSAVSRAGFVAHDPGPAPLGLVHRHVGPAQQLHHGRGRCRRRSPRPGRRGKAGARLDPDPHAGQVDRLRRGWPAAPAPAARPDRRRRPPEHHRELVAVQPGHQVVRADRPLQPAGDLDQQPVAGQRSPRVSLTSRNRSRSSTTSAVSPRLARARPRRTPAAGAGWPARSAGRAGPRGRCAAASRRASAKAAALRTAVRSAEAKVRRVNSSRSVSSHADRRSAAGPRRGRP